MRSIVHLDADAFFASVEQAADPRLRGQPVAVGGEKRGIIASASYEARRFGIYTPMPTARARKLCPRLILLPGDFEKYERFSRWMFSYAYDFTPDVEIGSIDEGYFDLSGACKPPVEIADTIRHTIRQALKITVSEGIGSNKLVSQIASKLYKPASFFHVPPGGERSFLHPLPNQWLPGVGPKTAERLNTAGLARVRQIAATPTDLLSLLVGRFAPQLKNFANGVDERPVVPASEPAKSYSQQETFAQDQTDEEFIEATLRRMADQLMAQVRADGKSIRTLTVKVRYNDMDEHQSGESLTEPADLETDLYPRLRLLLRRAWERRVSLRMVSLKLSNLYDGFFHAELLLDESARQHDARRRLATVIDDLRRQRGQGVVLRGHDFVLGEKAAAPGAAIEKEERRYKVTVAPKRGQANTGAAFPLPPALYREKGRDGPPGRPRDDDTGGAARPAVGPYLCVSKPPLPITARAIPPPRGRAAPREARGGSPVACPAFVVAAGEAVRASAPRPVCSSTAFVPLTVRSYYSFLDSTLSIKAIIELAKRHELPAVALCDQGNLHGAVEFVEAAKMAGIKPILGAEIRVQGRPLRLYVQNAAGYANLCRILSASNDRVRSRVPNAQCSMPKETPSLIDPWAPGDCEATALLELGHGSFIGAWSLDIGHSDGLLAVSPDRRLAEFFPGRFYLALSTPDELRHLGDPSLPLVAAPPVHYATPTDRWKYDVVQSIRTLTLLRQEHPEKSLTGDFHFPAPRQMQERFRGHPELLAHSREIADRCEFEFPFGKPQFPAFAPPDDSPPHAFLRKLVLRGFQKRYPQSQISNLKSQIETELAIIAEVGYEEYFLVVWDILQECRRRGIEWITRGSAADSLVCYCLEISGVCPVRFGLYFRRFLNKERMALHKLPDIDVDFPHDRKDDVIDLIFEKYGTGRCAVVGGFSTFQARSAFAEVAKVLGVAERDVRRITERFPWSLGGGTEIATLPSLPSFRRLPEKLRASPDCRDLPLDEEPYCSALAMAEFLADFPRYPKMHPCGVVLSRQSMHELTPTFVSNKGYPTTHFDMDAVEAIGLVKMDILAQGGLAVMRDVKTMLAERGVEVDLQRLVVRTLALGKMPNAQYPMSNEILMLNDQVASGAGNATESSGIGHRALGIGHSAALRLPQFPRTLSNTVPEEPWTDPAVWDMIARGHARAVHHIESPAMTSLCRMCDVHDIDTLIAIVSVIRPGAANEDRKREFTRRYQGLSPITYPHPSLEACLQDSYGLLIYEEQLLQICEAFAGLPAGRADVLRRALGKEKLEVVAEIAQEFVACAQARGRTDEDIARVWEMVSGFLGYTFCKAHSTAYGIEAYQSAWLKHYFPAEFMAAVLSNGKGFYRPLVYVLECHRLGISLLPPWVNEPGPGFMVKAEGRRQKAEFSNSGGEALRIRCPENASTRFPLTPALSLWEREAGPPSGDESRVARIVATPRLLFPLPVGEGRGEGKVMRETPLDWGTASVSSSSPMPSFRQAIRVPVTYVKGLTDGTKERILAERGRGEFVSLADFYRRTAPSPEEMELLIRVGALDGFGQSRPAQYWDFRLLLQAGSEVSASGQGWLLPPPDSHSALRTLHSAMLTEPSRRQRLEWESELLGFPASGHPLELYDRIAWETYCPVSRLGEFVGQEVVTCGLVIEDRVHHQVTGEPMKFLTLADWTGMIETELFAQTYQSYGLATVRYPVLEVTARVEPFENGRGFTLRVLRAGKPREAKG